MRLAIVISSLACGGSQRLLTMLANHWAATWDVHVVTVAQNPDEKPFFSLSSEISIHPLGLCSQSGGVFRAITSNLKRVRALREELREIRPDVVIGILDQTNVLTLMACRSLRLPVVITDQTNPAAHDPGKFWKMLMNRIYPWADRFVLQSERFIPYFPEGIQSRTGVIPNPVEHPPTDIQPADAPSPMIFCLGRLSHEKGFDLLIRAFAAIRDRHPQWSTVIAGDGPERASLRELGNSLGLGDSLILTGFVDSQYPYFAKTDIFALPSRYEGVPMSLCEAMSFGLPSVVTEYSDQVREIVDHEKNGLIVPLEDVDALANALDRLMSDGDLREILGTQAREIREKYSPETFLAAWDRELEMAMIRKKASGRR